MAQTAEYVLVCISTVWCAFALWSSMNSYQIYFFMISFSISRSVFFCFVFCGAFTLFAVAVVDKLYSFHELWIMHKSKDLEAYNFIFGLLLLQWISMSTEERTHIYTIIIAERSIRLYPTLERNPSIIL